MSSVKMLLILGLLVLAGCTPAQADPPAVALAVETQTPTQRPAALPTTEPTVVSTLPPTDLPPVPEPTVDPGSPRGVVAAFYQWYLAQPQGQVMSQRTFFESPYLSDIFKSDTNFLLDSFKDTAGYDPFTCAQNSLPSLTVAQVFVSGGEAHALAEVVIEEQVKHYFVVTLSASESDWKIETVHCPRQPETTAYAFYTWYLGSIFGDQNVENGAEILHNPVAEETYRDFFLLTPRLINAITEEVETNRAAGGGVDPFLNAQTLPVRFVVQPVEAENAVTVRLDYGVRSARYHNLSLVEAPAGWVINGIEHVEVPRFDPSANPGVDTTAWSEFRDEEYGFSFRYPEEWRAEAINLAGTPEEDLVKRGTFFFAPDLDPSVPLLWFNLLEGSEGQVINYYVTENHQEVEINGLRVWVDRETCSTRFVVPHPQRADTWLVFGDSCPTLPGREGYLEALDSLIAPLLRTVLFP